MKRLTNQQYWHAYWKRLVLSARFLDDYVGYRHVSKKKLSQYAYSQKIEVLYCDYLGVFSLGLINWRFIRNQPLRKASPSIFQGIDKVVRFLRIRKESRTFSPYIYLIGKVK